MVILWNLIQIKTKIAQKQPKKRNSLLYCNDDNKFQVKVCVICDTFIKYKDERPISVEWLLSRQVKQWLSVSSEEWNEIEVLEEDRTAIKPNYTQ